MEAQDLLINDIHIGDTARCSRTWTKEDVHLFSKLSGDYNPLHTEEEYAASTQFGKSVVHGMLVGSLCSQLVGMYIPGKRCLYLRQTLTFKHPVFIGDTIDAEASVTSVSESTSIVTLEITMKKNSTVVLLGEATVKVL